MNDNFVKAGSGAGVLGAHWIRVLWAINFFFLFCTYYQVAHWPEELVVRPFNLGNEQNLAAWWSGVQLLLAALLAHSAAYQVGQTHRDLRRALLVFAVLLLGMFADELGSFHERVAVAGGDRSLVPFAAIGIAALTYILRALHRHRAAVGNAWLLVLAAFGLFASVAVQEWMEHHLAWPEWLAPTRMGVEEGTEIVGFFLILLAVTGVRRCVEPPFAEMNDAPIGHVLLPSRRTLQTFLLGGTMAALPLIVVRSLFTAEQLVLPRRGDFGYVVPIMGMSIAALAALHHGLRANRSRRAWWALSLLLVVLSADACAHFHQYAFELLGNKSALGWRAWMCSFDSIGWRNDVDLLWTAPLLVVTAFAVPELRSGRLLLGAGAIVALALFSVFLVNRTALSLTVSHILPLGFAALLLQRLRRHSPAPDEACRSQFIGSTASTSH